MMKKERVPCLNAGFWIIFPVSTNIEELKKHLPPKTQYDIYEDEGHMLATIVEVKEIYGWEMDTVLTQLFSLCDLDRCKKVADMYSGQIHIGMWFYSGDASPAIILEGKNMEIIHRLNADLSLDAY